MVVGMDAAALLRARFDERRARNRRYSLRAFARDLGLGHGPLSQILARRRPASVAVIRAVGAARLGLEAALVERLVADENERKLRVSLRAWRGAPSVRALAARSGLAMDAVCIALQRMLAGGRLRMTAPTTWVLTEDER
jgi:hypothetical protein